MRNIIAVEKGANVYSWVQFWSSTTDYLFMQLLRASTARN